MHVPLCMRNANRVLTYPILRTVAWLVPPLAVVPPVGRKTGRLCRTPVVAFRSDAGFVIPMTYGRDVDWARNIIRANCCELERTGRRVVLLNPRIVGFDRARRRLPATLRPFFRAVDFPGYVLLDG